MYEQDMVTQSIYKGSNFEWELIETVLTTLTHAGMESRFRMSMMMMMKTSF